VIARPGTQFLEQGAKSCELPLFYALWAVTLLGMVWMWVKVDAACTDLAQ
jgi:hypothetical protein